MICGCSLVVRIVAENNEDTQLRVCVHIWFPSLCLKCSQLKGIDVQHFKSGEACNTPSNLYSEAISLIIYTCKHVNMYAPCIAV